MKIYNICVKTYAHSLEDALAKVQSELNEDDFLCLPAGLSQGNDYDLLYKEDPHEDN